VEEEKFTLELTRKQLQAVADVLGDWVEDMEDSFDMREDTPETLEWYHTVSAVRWDMKKTLSDNNHEELYDGG
jgi:hypothetical protein